MSVEKVCQHCGKKFLVPNRRHEEVKFCSRACKTSAGWVVHKCAKCGVVFKRKKSDGTRSRTAYCSKDCDRASRYGRKQAIDPDAPRYYKVCEVCGKDFRVTKTRVDTARTCSKSCSGITQSRKYEAERPTMKCGECGKEFKIPHCHAKRGDGRFCSTVCRNKSPVWREAIGVRSRGEKNWRWSGGRYQRSQGYIEARHPVTNVRTVEHRIVMLLALLEAEPEHPFIVHNDGVAALHKDIEVHHIDRNRSNNDLLNLLAIVRKAHSRLHLLSKKPEPWECWPSNPEKW